MNWLTNKFIEAESTLKQALSNATTSLAKSSSADEIAESYGITPALKEFVHNLCQHPNTFKDFPLEKDDGT